MATFPAHSAVSKGLVLLIVMENPFKAFLQTLPTVDSAITSVMWDKSVSLASVPQVLVLPIVTEYPETPLITQPTVDSAVLPVRQVYPVEVEAA